LIGLAKAGQRNVLQHHNGDEQAKHPVIAGWHRFNFLMVYTFLYALFTALLNFSPLFRIRLAIFVAFLNLSRACFRVILDLCIVSGFRD
jgi:hypothetical protein